MWAHTHQIRVVHNVLIEINSRSFATIVTRALYRKLPLISLRRQLKTQRQLHIRTNKGYKQATITRAINIQSSGGGGGNDKPYQRLRCPSSHQGRADPSSSASLVGPQHLRKGGRAGCGWLAVSGARRFMYMCPLRWTGSVQHVRLCDTCSVTRQARCEVQQTCHAFAFFAARHACTGGER